jgi:hypothetical protein
MSLMVDALEALRDELIDAGITPVLDVRNAAPPCVVIELPTVVDRTAGSVTLDVPIVCCAPPPGTWDSMLAIYDLADQVMDLYPTTTASPGTYRPGAQELPAVTVNITVSYTKE